MDLAEYEPYFDEGCFECSKIGRRQLALFYQESY